MKMYIEMKQEDIDALESLQQQLSIDRKELLNNALTLFRWSVKEVERGKSIASVSEDPSGNRVFRKVRIPAFDKITPTSSKS